jgi:hypothetical protein
MYKLQDRQNTSEDDVFMKDLEDVLLDVLLPSLQLIPCNPAASYEVWENILQNFPFETRYRLYAKWKSLTVCPELILSRAAAISEAKKILR